MLFYGDDMDIRNFTIQDMPDLIRLNNQVQQQHAKQYPEKFKCSTDPDKVSEFFKKLINCNSNKILVVSKQQTLLGYLWYEIQDKPENTFTYSIKRIYIHHVSVDRTVRRSGIATKLFNRVIQQAKLVDAIEVGLDTWNLNKDAQSFFEKQGFDAERVVYSKKLGR